MKRLISVLLLLTLVLSLFACDVSKPQNVLETSPLETTENQPTTPEETTPEETTPEETTTGDTSLEQPPKEEKKIKIVFYHTMGESQRDILNKYIVEFNKLYPDIVIDHKQVGYYDDVLDQIMTEIIVGDQPNIAYCYPDHVALYNIAYAVQTLDEYINSTEVVTRADGTTEVLGLTKEQIENFIDGYYEEGKVYGDGKMYTLPMSKSTEVLYYNKTFFEKNNLKVPTTWEELEAVCKQIKALDPNCIPLGYDSEANWFITMCEQLDSPYTSATGEHFLFDNEANRGFVVRLREWYQKGYVTTQEISGGYTSDLFTAGEDAVRSYMCIASSAVANRQSPKNDDGTFKFEVGIATIPQVNPNNPKVISQGPSLCIFKKSNPEEVKASWLFVKFLSTNLDFQAEFSLATGYMPVSKAVVDHPVFQDYLSMANGNDGLPMLAMKVAFEQADAFFAPPAFIGCAIAQEEVGALLRFCLTAPICATAEGIQHAFEQAIKECNHRAGY